MPDGLMEEVIEARVFAEAVRTYDRLGDMDEKTRGKMMTDPLLQIVRDIDFGQAEAEIEDDG